MINYSVYTPDPQKVIGIIENVSFNAYNLMIFVKISRGGREVNMINTLSPLSKHINGFFFTPMQFSLVTSIIERKLQSGVPTKEKKIGLGNAA